MTTLNEARAKIRTAAATEFDLGVGSNDTHAEFPEVVRMNYSNSKSPAIPGPYLAFGISSSAIKSSTRAPIRLRIIFAATVPARMCSLGFALIVHRKWLSPCWRCGRRGEPTFR